MSLLHSPMSVWSGYSAPCSRTLSIAEEHHEKVHQKLEEDLEEIGPPLTVKCVQCQRRANKQTSGWRNIVRNFTPS